MTPSELLSEFLLIIVVLVPLSLMFLAFLRESRNNKQTILTLLTMEVNRNQTMLNLLTSPSFEVFAGMQSMTPRPMVVQSESQMPSPTSASEYIPRDDITEAARINTLSRAFGVGEEFFQEEPELANMLADMRAKGQIDFGEDG